MHRLCRGFNTLAGPRIRRRSNSCGRFGNCWRVWPRETNSPRSSHLSGRGAGPGTDRRGWVGENCAHGRSFTDVAVHAKHAEIRALAGERVVVGHDLSRRAVVGEQRTDRVASHFAGQPRSDQRVADTPREGQADRRVKEAGVLQKELPLLRKEHLKALVHHHLGSSDSTWLKSGFKARSNTSRSFRMKNDSPALPGSGKPQTAERNRHPDYIAFWSQPALGVPQRVERIVEAAALRIEPVELDAERVADKRVRAPLVMERIEHDFDEIVIVDVLAVSHPRADQPGVGIEGHKHDVEFLVVVAEVNDRGLRGGFAVLRLALEETFHLG